MPDYSEGKVYAIRAPNVDEVYIGSTVNTLTERFSQHKYEFRQYKSGRKYKYTSAFKILENPGAYIELIEEVSCNSKDALTKRENEIMRNTVNCLNMRGIHIKQIQSMPFIIYKDFTFDGYAFLD